VSAAGKRVANGYGYSALVSGKLIGDLDAVNTGLVADCVTGVTPASWKDQSGNEHALAAADRVAVGKYLKNQYGL
jgi:hypothetical protein